MTNLRHAAVRVPATTANLGPGFDAFGAALGIHLWARSRDRTGSGAARVTTRGELAGELPDGDDNLLWRAFVAACDLLGAPVPDVAVDVRTDIPLERGLGSSSAAIVAGVALARAVTGAVAGDLELVTLATELEGHPDNVAPAVLGGLVVCAPDDDGTLVVRRHQPAPRLDPVVLVPRTRQATTSARAVLPETLSADDVALQAARAGHVVGSLLGAWSADAGAVGDRLHEPPRLAVMEPSKAVLEALRDAGAHAWLSGAGPALAAAVPAPSDGAGPPAAVTAAAGEDFRVHAPGWDLGGVVACPEGGCAWSGTPGCAACPREAVGPAV